MRVHAWADTARVDGGGPRGVALSRGLAARTHARLVGTSSCAP